MDTPDPIKLTDRERLIIHLASEAASEAASRKVEERFYQHVGKTFISKILIYIGMFAVGIATAKGWVKFW